MDLPPDLIEALSQDDIRIWEGPNLEELNRVGPV